MTRFDQFEEEMAELDRRFAEPLAAYYAEQELIDKRRQAAQAECPHIETRPYSASWSMPVCVECGLARGEENE